MGFASTSRTRKEIEAARRRIYFFGTPEKKYLDSGLFLYAKYARTKDEHDPMGSIQGKLLPRDENGRLKEYILQTLWHFLVTEKMALPKSRQIMISWLLAAYTDWVSQALPYQRTLIQSKKEQAAKDLVSHGWDNPTSGRISFIHNHLPAWLQDPKILTKQGNQSGMLRYSTGSEVYAAAQGGDQARSYTISRLILDEMAFQDKAEASYVAGLPAVQGGGQFIGASSVAPGFFREMCLNIEGGLTDVEVPNEAPWLPAGMKRYRTRDKVDVLRIHYSADPDKNLSTERGRRWYEMIADGYVGGIHNPGFKREMELEWDIMGGKPVYPYLYRADHPIYCKAPPDDLIRTMYVGCGLDHGTTSPSAFEVWGRDPAGRSYTLWEVYGEMSVKQMAEAIKNCPYFGLIRSWRADPSIWKVDQQKGDGTCAIADLYEAEGLFFQPGYRGADRLLYEQLRSGPWANHEEPMLFITDRTPVLKNQMANMRWEEHTSAHAIMFRDAPETMVQKENHSPDAFAYSFTRAESTTDVPKIHVVDKWSIEALENEFDDMDRPQGRVCGRL